MDTRGAVQFERGHDSALDFITLYTSFSKNHERTTPSKEHTAMEDSPIGDLFEEDVFCTQANLQQRLKFVNEEISSYGFSSFLDENGKLRLPHLVNCVHEILHRQAKQRQAKEDMDAKQLRLESDNDYLVQSIAKHKDNYEGAQREICILKLKEKQALAKGDALQAELKIERDEVKRMKSDMHHKLKQFQHESRRNEREVIKLKERLHQAISSKAESKMGLETLRTLQKTAAKRGTWGKNGKDGDDVYRLVILSHEDRKRELMAENLKLRHYIAELQSKMVGLIDLDIADERGGESLADHSDEENTDPVAKRLKKTAKSCLLNSHLEMPFELSRPEIDKEFDVLWHTLRSCLEQRSEKAVPATNQTPKEVESFMKSEIEILSQQLAQYKDIVEKQERVLKTVYDDSLLSKLESSLKADGSSSAEQKLLQSELSRLKEEKSNFAVERDRFTEYALSLCRERRAFEQERAEFYQHSISTPVLAKQESNRRQHEEVDAVTPKRRSSDCGAVKTPSTLQLYKFLGLTTPSDKDTTSNRSPLSGSYIENTPNVSGGTPKSKDRSSSRRLDEHITNVRKAVEQRQHTT